MSRTDDNDLADLMETSPTKQRQQQQYRQQQKPDLFQFIWAHVSYYCTSYCSCLACIALLVAVAGLVGSHVWNPTQSFGDLKSDFSNIKSQFELDVGKIDHWCLGGGNDGCKCQDPLLPTSRVEMRSWTEAFKANKKEIQKYVDDPVLMADLDVAIIGESAIEEMDGRWMGRRPNDELVTIGTIFKNHFNRNRGGKVEGVALGIAGDTANNILWRLIHGEMPDSFNPKVWWVHVGANDLTRQQCSEEVVVLGVLRVVEEILVRRPNARIVINSLLPMADLRGSKAVMAKDYQDAFNTYGGKRARTSATHYVRKTINGVERIVPADPTKKESSSDDRHKRHHHRQLLEKALTDYSAAHFDNSAWIEHLQQQLETDLDDSAEDGIGHRHLERLEPKGEPTDSDDKKESRAAKKRTSKDKYNPTINKEKHSQKKYNFFRKRRMPLWTSIFAINHQLFRFCEKHERVDFFDATNIFAEKKKHDDGGSQKFFTLMSDVISSRGHPTELGFLKWEDIIVEKLQIILTEMKEASPELFMTHQKGVDLPVGGKGATDIERLEKKPVEDDSRGDNLESGGNADESSSEDSISTEENAEEVETDGEGGGEEKESNDNEDDSTEGDVAVTEEETEGDETESQPQPENSGFQPQPQQGFQQQQQQQQQPMVQQPIQGNLQQEGYAPQQQYAGGIQQQQPMVQQPIQGGFQQESQSGIQGGYQSGNQPQQPYPQQQPVQGANQRQIPQQPAYQQQQPMQSGQQQQPYQEQQQQQQLYPQQQQQPMQPYPQQQPMGGESGYRQQQSYQQPQQQVQAMQGGSGYQQQPEPGMPPNGGKGGGNFQAQPGFQEGSLNQEQPLGGMAGGTEDEDQGNTGEETKGDLEQGETQNAATSDEDGEGGSGDDNLEEP